MSAGTGPAWRGDQYWLREVGLAMGAAASRRMDRRMSIAPAPAADLDVERLAIAARLHVLLRRITGRLIDIDWLVVNDDYASEIVRLARLQAHQLGRPELAACADELARASAQVQAAAPRTLFERVAWSLRQSDAERSG